MTKKIKISGAVVAASILGIYLFISPPKQTEVSHVDSHALTLGTSSKKPVQIPDSPTTEAAKPESQPASESKRANGKFGSINAEKFQFHSSVVNVSQIKKDQLSKIIDGLSTKNTDKAKGRFFMVSGNAQGFSGKLPTMTPLSKDDYDHAISTLTDKDRSKHGFVFHFRFNVWKQSIDDKELIKLMNDVNLQKDNIKLALIRGHADAIGTNQVNFEISSKRATHIMKMLPDVKVIVESVGENEPVADNDTARGRALNRRTELIFIMKKPGETSVKGAQTL